MQRQRIAISWFGLPVVAALCFSSYGANRLGGTRFHGLVVFGRAAGPAHCKGSCATALKVDGASEAGNQARHGAARFAWLTPAKVKARGGGW